MSVAAALRAGLQILDTVTASTQVSLDYYARSGVNSSGEDQYPGTATSTITAVMVRDIKRILDKDMNEVTSDTQLIVPRDFACSVRDQFVYGTKTFKIVGIKGVNDPTTNRPFSNEIFLVGGE